MSLRTVFDHLSDPMFVVLLSTDLQARDLDRSARLLHELRERIGPRRIVLVVSDPPGPPAGDRDADWIDVDPAELHKAVLRKPGPALADTLREILAPRRPAPADPLSVGQGRPPLDVRRAQVRAQ